jgi:hypothetical protein
MLKSGLRPAGEVRPEESKESKLKPYGVAKEQ